MTSPAPHGPLPPGQQLVAPGKWPVVGERSPRTPAGPWTVSIRGDVERSLSWSLDQLQEFPQVTRRIDIHCVTRWSRLQVAFSGLSLSTLLDACGPTPTARYASFVAHSERAHSTSLPLSFLVEADAIIAFQADGRPLPPEHGGPVRVVVPGRYFYKSLKWLSHIELIAEDRLGHWEALAGYHNGADPWNEERFLAASLDAKAVRTLLARRDFTGLDLRGLMATGMDLRELKATGAKLRDAHLERADLRQSCFDGANLSGAHLQLADLRGASFQTDATGQAADLEGADFSGADLRGAKLIGASLFGATFGTFDASDAPMLRALVDDTTQIDQASLASLEATPAQREFLRNATILASPLPAIRH